VGILTRCRYVVSALLKLYVMTRYHRLKVWEARRREARHGYQPVLGIEDGEAEFDNGHYAIFLIWQPKCLPWYVINALDALYQERVNVIVVANHKLKDEQRAYLRTRASKIMVRDNSGFDMGGFRDATRYLSSHSVRPRKLIYMNDSVYYMERGLHRMIRQMLDEPADVVGTFENWEIHYHLQSFCMSVSERVFASETFTKFWQNYLAVDSRVWAINEGEVGLSRAIMSAAESVKILYSVNELRMQLGDVSPTAMSEMHLFLPGPVRTETGIYKELPSHLLANDICERVMQRSQIHTSGFFFMKYCDCPLVKRDLVYRLMFAPNEVELNLESLGYGKHVPDIMVDLRKKGSGDHLGGITRRRFNEGLI
jgi:hypothetical protein